MEFDLWLGRHGHALSLRSRPQPTVTPSAYGYGRVVTPAADAPTGATSRPPQVGSEGTLWRRIRSLRLSMSGRWRKGLTRRMTSDRKLPGLRWPAQAGPSTGRLFWAEQPGHVVRVEQHVPPPQPPWLQAEPPEPLQARAAASTAVACAGSRRGSRTPRRPPSAASSSSGRMANVKTSCRGQPSPTSTSRAPDSRIRCGDLGVLARPGRHGTSTAPTRRSSGRARASAAPVTSLSRVSIGRAVQVDRQPLVGAAAQHPHASASGP